MKFCGLFSNTGDDEEKIEAVDSDAAQLSYVGKAAYQTLRTRHGAHHHALWNVTSGRVIGDLRQTPKDVWSRRENPPSGADDWFPETMRGIMSKTKVWIDVMSLGPPDGLFLDAMKEGLKDVAANAAGAKKPIIVRMMFGNIVGMPVNCDAVIKELTSELPGNANIEMWVGAWRCGSSWNHAKIIAVDARYLHTGGHNLWDAHYLKSNPVHDLSIELEGRVACDGHLFANQQWAFIEAKQSTRLGQCAENLPDSVPLVWKNRVIVSEWPEAKAAEFPPVYNKKVVPPPERADGDLPIISLGRSGALLRKDRPSDDAFVAMIDSAKKIVRMTLQDLGPVCVPNTKMALPGLTWPKNYLDALARVIWLREVDVEIVLSNPGSIPGGLGAMEACYGNGWSCVDVCAEIIKRILKQFPNAEDSELRKRVKENLRVCFVKHAQSSTYEDGGNIGLHSKYFIVDNVCSYTGSQNLYVCDLAEWGVVVDDVDATKRMLATYWQPMWDASYLGINCDVQEVMDGLHIERDGQELSAYTVADQAKMGEAARIGSNSSGNAKFYGTEVDAA